MNASLGLIRGVFLYSVRKIYNLDSYICKKEYNKIMEKR